MNEAVRIRHSDSREELREWATKGRLFALVDPFFDFPDAIEKRHLEVRDTDPVFFESIAWERVTYEPPYLAVIDAAHLDWLLNSLSTERWGLFLVAEASVDELAQHFQKFVIARGPDQNPYFLRFHDAAVLEVLLRTWNPREKGIFFGPTLMFGLPDLDTMDVQLERNSFGLREWRAPLPEECLIELRESQLQACGEAIDRDLVKVIYWHLRNHHAKSVQFVSRRVLEERIQFAIAKARRYALGTIADLAGFTALMFELAPNFDQHPSFKRVLVDESIPAETKMRRLSQVITDAEWEEVVRLYDRSYWPSVLKKPTRRRTGLR